MQAEVILEGGIDGREHLDVCAGREKLVACAGQDDDVDVVLHARAENGGIELLIHLVGVGVRGGIAHFDDRYSTIGSIVHQLLCAFTGSRLHSCRHE